MKQVFFLMFLLLSLAGQAAEYSKTLIVIDGQSNLGKSTTASRLKKKLDEHDVGTCSLDYFYSLIQWSSRFELLGTLITKEQSWDNLKTQLKDKKNNYNATYILERWEYVRQFCSDIHPSAKCDGEKLINTPFDLISFSSLSRYELFFQKISELMQKKSVVIVDLFFFLITETNNLPLWNELISQMHGTKIIIVHLNSDLQSFNERYATRNKSTNLSEHRAPINFTEQSFAQRQKEAKNSCIKASQSTQLLEIDISQLNADEVVQKILSKIEINDFDLQSAF